VICQPHLWCSATVFCLCVCFRDKPCFWPKLPVLWGYGTSSLKPLFLLVSSTRYDSTPISAGVGLLELLAGGRTQVAPPFILPSGKTLCCAWAPQPDCRLKRICWDGCCSAQCSGGGRKGSAGGRPSQRYHWHDVPVSFPRVRVRQRRRHRGTRALRCLRPLGSARPRQM
jgi:hypothetical protein